MAFRNLHQIGAFYRTPRSQNPPICLEAQETMQLVFRMSRNLPWSHGSSMTLRSAMAVELPLFSSDKRSLSTQVKAPAQARQMMVHKKGVEKNKRRHNYRDKYSNGKWGQKFFKESSYRENVFGTQE